MLRNIIILIVIFAVSRIIRSVIRKRIQYQNREQPPSRTIRISTERPKEALKELKNSDYEEKNTEYSTYDEEAYDEEQKPSEQTSEQQPQSIIAQKHKPVSIAGISLTPKTVAQGIIMSEILRRPKY